MAGQRLTDKTALDQQTGSGDLYMIVDVSDTTGSTAGTSKKLDSKFVIQTDKISVSNAEFQAMDATGSAGTFKTLVSAPGAGFMIIPFCVTILTTYASATDSANKSLYISYDNTQSAQYWSFMSRFMSGATTSRTFQQSSNISTTGANPISIEDKPLFLYSNGNFNGGFSADVYITYNIAKLL